MSNFVKIKQEYIDIRLNFDMILYYRVMLREGGWYITIDTNAPEYSYMDNKITLYFKTEQERDDCLEMLDNLLLKNK